MTCKPIAHEAQISSFWIEGSSSVFARALAEADTRLCWRKMPMSSLAWGDTFKNFLNEVGAGEAEDVLKEFGIVSVDDLVRRSMDDLPLSEELQKRLSLGISIESHRRALRERARRHAADSTSPTNSPQPVPESPASHHLHPVGSPSMVLHTSMEDSFEEQLAALREAKEAGDISARS